jgi:hypothetical protein
MKHTEMGEGEFLKVFAEPWAMPRRAVVSPDVDELEFPKAGCDHQQVLYPRLTDCRVFQNQGLQRQGIL